MVSASDVTSKRGKEPSAHCIRPDDLASKSCGPPPPTALDLNPETCLLAIDPFAQGVHVSSVHSMLGYEAWKHPRLDMGANTIDFRQSSKLMACSAPDFVISCACPGPAIEMNIKTSRTKQKCRR